KLLELGRIVVEIALAVEDRLAESRGEVAPAARPVAVRPEAVDGVAVPAGVIRGGGGARGLLRLLALLLLLLLLLLLAGLGLPLTLALARLDAADDLAHLVDGVLLGALGLAHQALDLLENLLLGGLGVDLLLVLEEGLQLREERLLGLERLALRRGVEKLGGEL